MPGIEIATAFVSLIPDGSKLGKGIRKEVDAAASSAGASGGQKLGDALNRGMAPAVGTLGALGAAATAAALKGEELASSYAGLEQVLSNMGQSGASDRLKDLADEQERLLGIDEKTILATQTKLATFSEVAKSADVAGGAFDRATIAAQDMAAAGFGDAESNAVQLGKALQDPVKGITALGRAGVTFTAQQKEQIKALVEGGKAAEAQDLILKELEKQVGGVAAAQADASAILSLSFGELIEKVGLKLLPTFEKVALAAAGFIGGLNPNVIIALGAAVAGLAGFIIAANIAMKIYTATQTAIKVATAAWTAVQWLLNAALTANPIGLVVLAIVALVGILILAYKKSDTFRAIVNKAFGLVKTAVLALVGAAVSFGARFASVISSVIGAVGRFLSSVKSKFGDAVSFVKGIPGKILGFFGDFGSLLFDKGKALIQGLIDGIKAMIGKVKDAVGEVAGAIGKFLPGSPVKEGPLKSWNRGAAGIRLMDMLADGITSGASSVGMALDSALSPLNPQVAFATSGLPGSQVRDSRFDLRADVTVVPTGRQQADLYVNGKRHAGRLSGKDS